MLRKIFKIFAFILALVIALYFYLLSDYNPMFKNDDFIYLTKTLKNTKAEDLEEIVSLYNKINEKESHACSCETVLKMVNSYNYGNLLKKAIYISKIKKEFTPDICLKLVLLNYDFCFRNKGIHTATQFYFHKTVQELNEKEKLTIVAMLRNAALFNPIRNPKKLKERILIYQQILKQQEQK
ncbi:transglycosylase domain-containing protein [Flavobacterium sp. KACC 22761]|uniref:transglycosylase domain-containing protein n=1 Tax=Flavobacterium sp. KACC 22761 TaxID=3092665 RepID=UPI002A759F59|nr:transglycosylase domain-containing protein [Flavobacterium sp. KACC 22761]WPO77039.1 transglycosylase domain-containing protein [Flavobacterium sp. KACC 22761]